MARHCIRCGAPTYEKKDRYCLACEAGPQRPCELCGSPTGDPTDRYCASCEADVIGELLDAGYLEPAIDPLDREDDERRQRRCQRCGRRHRDLWTRYCLGCSEYFLTGRNPC